MTPLQQRYLELLAQLKHLTALSGRLEGDVTLVAVSKGRPISALQELIDIGVRDFGESRAQELEQKQQELSSPLNWHFIGTLQRNKVAKVLKNCHLIHSVDQPVLADKIASYAERAPILLQVNILEEPTKHGLSAEGWLPHLERLFQTPTLTIQGLMTLAPKGASEKEIIRSFSGLRKLKESWEKRFLGQMPHLSMGMSQDYPIAIAEGATLLRLGAAIFSESSDK